MFSSLPEEFPIQVSPKNFQSSSLQNFPHPPKNQSTIKKIPNPRHSLIFRSKRRAKSQEFPATIEINIFPVKYANIEEFFDREELFIVSPSPIITKIQLKPILGIKKLHSFTCVPTKDDNKENLETNGGEKGLELSLPSLLKKRKETRNLVKKTSDLLKFGHIEEGLQKKGFGMKNLMKENPVLSTPLKLV